MALLCLHNSLMLTQLDTANVQILPRTEKGFLTTKCLPLQLMLRRDNNAEALGCLAGWWDDEAIGQSSHQSDAQRNQPSSPATADKQNKLHYNRFSSLEYGQISVDIFKHYSDLDHSNPIHWTFWTMMICHQTKLSCQRIIYVKKKIMSPEDIVHAETVIFWL